MTRSPYRAATLGGSADETEAAFYEALQTGNLERLMACWAEEDDIVCVNPGGPRLLGAAAIRAAFSAMFEHGTLRARPAQVHRVQAMASAVHSVVEHVEVVLDGGVREAIVQSTNVYHKTPQGWRLVAHHASPGTVHEAQAPGHPPPVLH
ncbi:nuclear transport factor 2 family protein [Acidovorax sp. SUPP950]|uniref:YybH family protein n=1 Tax=unclassified Acidovorax TaxID=2684926 RepID=UPI00234A21BE|nr:MULTISPECIES: nuclear transport factor 2 family protein [Comamonadaceae]WCM97402.1 nuclear transport factor 2 family protein [Acidovorax sp. GBBC 1281]WOI44454.1 nuclear transport factor 2 family protein [Paracidovorax avenae]GKS76938.1 nuclear transport factor 2 family protein [Acidovorax sp. SUPP950]GKS86829.1 nuclear transport factor 2 family protein [Acidovorax sp. SUPP1855]GKS91645.1 nuclear transport factor 2 family protein [Acidovorax sp. SUPP2539]